MPQDHGHDEVNRERNDDSASVDVSPDKPSSEQAKASTDAEQSEQIKKLNRRVIVAWVAAAFGPLIALAGLVFSGLQWKVADGQLAVMREQLQDARVGAEQARKDTDTVIAAAKSQADAAKSQAESMRILAEANRVMAEADNISAQSSTRIASASEKSSAMAVRSIDIAQETARLQWTEARDATRLEHRPWLLVRSANLVKTRIVPFAETFYRVDIVLENAGKTPAADVMTYAFVRVIDANSQNFGRLIGMDGPPMTAIPEFIQKTPDGMRFRLGDLPQVHRTPMVVGAGDTMSLDWEVYDGEVVVGEVRSGGKYLIVVGTVYYRDTFGVGRRTRYCYHASIESINTGALKPCPGNNKDDTQKQGEPYTPFE